MGKFNKNPLFVVSKDTVEEVENFFEFFVKKLGLDPLVKFFEQILFTLMEQVKDYSSLLLVQSWLETLIEVMKNFTSTFDDSIFNFVKQNILKKA